MNYKALILMIFFPLLMMGPLPHVNATVYKPGLTEGNYMKYEVKHSPKISEILFLVTSVNNDTIVLDITETSTNGTLINSTLSLSFGELIFKDEGELFLSTNSTYRWNSVFGRNTLSVVEDYMEIRMTDSNRTKFNEIAYISDESIDLSDSSTIEFEISLDDISLEERYFMSFEDEYGQAVSFEFSPEDVPDPRTQEYLMWDKILINLPTDLDVDDAGIDYSKIKKVGLLYSGSLDRTIRLRNIQNIEIVEVGHIYKFYRFFPIYLVIATGLEDGDQIYPDLPVVISGEDEVVHQEVKRTIVKGEVVFVSEGETFVVTEYIWDKETGILLESSFTARGVREIKLIETNAWAPTNLLVYLFTAVTTKIPSALESFWSHGGGMVVGILVIWVAGFGTIYLYDKSKRNELRAFKQWLPFLYILVIASIVSFLLLRVLPLAFVD